MEVICNMWSVRDILRSQGETIIQSLIPGTQSVNFPAVICSVDIQGTIRVRVGIVHLVWGGLCGLGVGVRPRLFADPGNVPRRRGQRAVPGDSEGTRRWQLRFAPFTFRRKLTASYGRGEAGVVVLVQQQHEDAARDSQNASEHASQHRVQAAKAPVHSLSGVHYRVPSSFPSPLVSPHIPHFRAHDRVERVSQARVLHGQLPQDEAWLEPDALVGVKEGPEKQDCGWQEKDGGIGGGVYPRCV